VSDSSFPLLSSVRQNETFWYEKGVGVQVEPLSLKNFQRQKRHDRAISRISEIVHQSDFQPSGHLPDRKAAETFGRLWKAIEAKMTTPHCSTQGRAKRKEKRLQNDPERAGTPTNALARQKK